ncbi:GntR family transcriptional regulator [Nocardia terpenica]|uniref:GntR family transcriptional regulator n=1 Tax=Nocardia terpenica TaxID=455432 RepID=A0A6G9Z0R9_9NOCA|nr:GntR family transcriptional regulator [Nocardia terpenica]QIS19209.1 GntR family transcriptional regulator [Nocardia terpenica]
MAAKYERVAENIRHQIKTGRLSAGDQLPPETTLAGDHKVSVSVIRQAMGVLRAEGLIESQHGIGTFVRAPRQKVRRESARHQWEKDRARTAEAERRTTGATERDTGLSIDDLEFSANYQIVKADKRIASIFDIPTGTKLLRREYRTQLRAEGSPLNLSTSYLVHDIVSENPKLLDAKNEPWPGGTQHQLYTIGIEVDKIIESVTTRPPNTNEMEELDLSPGVAVFVVHKQTIDTSGRTVEYSDVILPGDRTELVFETKLTRWDKR